MTAQKVAQKLRLQQWANQIEECEQSGLSVQQWCEENGLGYKNYFYRKRRVREELLETMGSERALMKSSSCESRSEVPVFVPLSALPAGNTCTAATVRIGAYTAEISNGADTETIECVLRTLVRL